MLNFQKFDPAQKDAYQALLASLPERGCEYSFANLCLWGRQRAAFVEGFWVIFSQFGRSSVYPFPVGTGDAKPALDAIICDARSRGIVCRLTGLTAGDCMTLEERYPGKFRFHPDRDGCDYVYDIQDLAELKGRKFQKKRNHVNKFYQLHLQAQVLPLTEETLPQAVALADAWYESREEGDFHLEQQALRRAFSRMAALDMEGLVLMDGNQPLAITLGSPLRPDTFDIHFEKAVEDGAYAAINQAFARYLGEKHPQLRFLNREDDMGIPGLRKAKLSYCPHHLVEKFWARLWEDEDED